MFDIIKLQTKCSERSKEKERLAELKSEIWELETLTIKLNNYK